MSRHLIGNYLAYSFGTFCILSALPFVGVPFPSRAAADYYAGPNGKIKWISDLSGHRITSKQAGYFGAGQRIVLGLCLISPKFRRPSAALMGIVVSYGTVVAVRDGRPLLPQIGMLSAIAAVLISG